MHESLKVGRPVPVEELPTLADSLGGGIGLRNRHTFAMARALVDQVILVDEAEIAGAIRHAYAEERQIVEGGAADRKSGVSGKSVSVRVDLGGSRISKKKK